MIAITVITGTRPVPTIDNTISSLRNSGFNQKINISADPGAIIGKHDNVEIFYNKAPIGNCQLQGIKPHAIIDDRFNCFIVWKFNTPIGAFAVYAL